MNENSYISKLFLNIYFDISFIDVCKNLYNSNDKINPKGTIDENPNSTDISDTTTNQNPNYFIIEDNVQLNHQFKVLSKTDELIEQMNTQQESYEDLFYLIFTKEDFNIDPKLVEDYKVKLTDDMIYQPLIEQLLTNKAFPILFINHFHSIISNKSNQLSRIISSIIDPELKNERVSHTQLATKFMQKLFYLQQTPISLFEENLHVEQISIFNLFFNQISFIENKFTIVLISNSLTAKLLIEASQYYNLDVKFSSLLNNSHMVNEVNNSSIKNDTMNDEDKKDEIDANYVVEAVRSYINKHNRQGHTLIRESIQNNIHLFEYLVRIGITLKNEDFEKQSDQIVLFDQTKKQSVLEKIQLQQQNSLVDKEQLISNRQILVKKQTRFQFSIMKSIDPITSSTETTEDNTIYSQKNEIALITPRKDELNQSMDDFTLNNSINSNNNKNSLAKCIIAFNKESFEEIKFDHNTLFNFHPFSVQNPPENPLRLNWLVKDRFAFLEKPKQDNEVVLITSKPVEISDLLRVHDVNYILMLRNLKNKSIEVNQPVKIDSDTDIDPVFFEAAMHSANTIIQTVDYLQKNQMDLGFCYLRPPGHHIGPYGKVMNTQMNESDATNGFCLFNNVAMGASQTKQNQLKQKRIVIFDFDLHHGNGTEAIVKALQPCTMEKESEGQFGSCTYRTQQWKPWQGINDYKEVMLISLHAYGHNSKDGSFIYPNSGNNGVQDIGQMIKDDFIIELINEGKNWEDFSQICNQYDIIHETREIIPNGEEFKQVKEKFDELWPSQQKYYDVWKAINKNSNLNKFKLDSEEQNINLYHGNDLLTDNIINIPLEQGTKGLMQRQALRKIVYPKILEFKPSAIFVSAGFDVHRGDKINGGHVGVQEKDFEQIAEGLLSCKQILDEFVHEDVKTKVVSVLEGGQNLKGENMSPFVMSNEFQLDGWLQQEKGETQEQLRGWYLEQNFPGQGVGEKEKEEGPGPQQRWIMGLVGAEMDLDMKQVMNTRSQERKRPARRRKRI